MWMKGKVYMPALAVGKLLGWTVEVDEPAGLMSIATH